MVHRPSIQHSLCSYEFSVSLGECEGESLLYVLLKLHSEGGRFPKFVCRVIGGNTQTNLLRHNEIRPLWSFPRRNGQVQAHRHLVKTVNRWGRETCRREGFLPTFPTSKPYMTVQDHRFDFVYKSYTVLLFFNVTHSVKLVWQLMGKIGRNVAFLSTLLNCRYDQGIL